MKSIYTTIAIVLSIFVTNCGSDEQKTIADNSNPISVKVATAQINDNQPFLSASGKIQAVNSAELSTRMMGYVDKVHVNVGDKVRKAQLLISINNADLKAKRAQVNATINEANAAFKNAEKDYNRFKNLFADNSATQKELDDMTTKFEMAKAHLESAKQMRSEVESQFTYANIRAPYNGVITNKFVKAGDMANPGMPLIAIETPGSFEVIAMLPESEISKVKSDTEVNVLIKSIAKTIKGKVTEVSTSAKHTGGQYLVKIALDKTDAAILSGMFTTVQFPIEKSETTSSILIPREAIVTQGQLSGIYTISQSETAVLRWLRLGRTFGDKVEVLSGLSADESYIVSSEGKLYNGVKISSTGSSPTLPQGKGVKLNEKNNE